jgi:tetratricopeptide (TPR) repeat protein
METAAAVPETIRAFDPDGKELLIPREQWRTETLPNLIRESWGEPEQLYRLILNSINDGFTAEIAEAAQHLHATDPLHARGACTYAIALMEVGKASEAKQILLAYTHQHGEEGSVLTNLAQASSLCGQAELVEPTLWRALTAEPNLDHGLAWYIHLQQEQSPEAAVAALKLIATLPGAWRARLWLARGRLEAGDLATASALYREALELAPRPVPGDFLMQMSGDLGTAGHIAALIELTAPHFIPEFHGLPVGNNLIKANFDLGNLAAVAALHGSLAAFNRPDWREPLAFWEQEIARVRAAPQAPAQPVQMGMLRIDGPIWMPPGSPGQELFGSKLNGGPSVTFLGGTAETTGVIGQQIDPRAIEGPGRMSRALPLFLAEQVEMRSAARGRAMLPWAVGGGFVVTGAVWGEQSALQAGKESDYVVTVHIDAGVEPWTAELVFLRTADGARIGELDAEFPSSNPEQALPKLADEVVELLGGASGARGYHAPEGDGFTPYLARLEQLLAVRCAAMEGVPESFLQGEHEILAGHLAQVAGEPENLASRLLLIETFAAVERVRPASAAAFRPQIEELLGVDRAGFQAV